MGFEEIREQLNYLHQRRNYSKRKNKFEISEDKENHANNSSMDPLDSKIEAKAVSSKRQINSRREEKPELESDIEMKRKFKFDVSPITKSPFPSFIAEKDPKNKARYLPPSKLKKAPTNYQGRRTVKFRDQNDYSTEN